MQVIDRSFQPSPNTGRACTHLFGLDYERLLNRSTRKFYDTKPLREKPLRNL